MKRVFNLFLMTLVLVATATNVALSAETVAEQEVGADVFGLDIDTLQADHDERVFLHKLKNLVLNLKGSSTWFARSYHFYITWKVANNIAYVSKVSGDFGDGHEKYEINFDAEGFNYSIEGTDKELQLAKLTELLGRVAGRSDKLLKDAEGFKLKVPSFSYVMDSGVNRMMDRIWGVIWKKNGGSIPGVELDWSLNNYGQDGPELKVVGLKGEWDNTRFEINFQSISKGFFELKLLDKSRTYGFSASYNCGYFKVPNSIYLEPGSSYYRENADSCECAWSMDYKHKAELNEFMNSFLTEIEK